jgi:hypothetical protein
LNAVYKGQARMDNTETQEVLDTSHRTKTTPPPKKKTTTNKKTNKKKPQQKKIKK